MASDIAVGFAIGLVIGFALGYAVRAGYFLSASSSSKEAARASCRRRHQARRPPLAKSRPGSPAPAMGPGTPLGTARPVTLDDENIGPTKVTCTELSGSDDRPRLFTKEMVSRVSRPSKDVILLDVEPEGFVWASEPKHAAENGIRSARNHHRSDPGTY
jgi:hypothetical protein